MNNRAKSHFVACYVKVLTRAWGDAEFCAWLESDPRSALAANGLPLHGGIQVDVVRPSWDFPDVQLQLAMWQDGLASDRCVLIVPRVDVRTLTDDQLDELSGGAAAAFLPCSCPWCARQLR